MVVAIELEDDSQGPTPRETPAWRCSHRPPCPGCPRFGEGLAEHPALIPLAAFAREHGVELALEPEGDARGYRIRARLAVRGRVASPKLGIFQAGTHRIVDIPSCIVHHPRINDAAALLKQAMRDTLSEPYADVPHRGLVRYLQVVVERESGSAQLVLVGNCETVAPVEALCQRLTQLFGLGLHSLFFSPQPERSNAIMGARCDKLSGPDAVEERIGHVSVFFPPDAFGQSHLALYERIVARIGALVPDGSEVFELYAGTGAIGLSLIERSRRVRFNEIGAGSLHGLCMGIDALAPQLRARAELYPGPVAERVGLLGSAEIVIADPPRKGLDPALLTALCTTPPARFIYLSCGRGSFLDDARALLASGRYRLGQLNVFDLFPFTEHVEILASFERC